MGWTDEMDTLWEGRCASTTCARPGPKVRGAVRGRMAKGSNVTSHSSFCGISVGEGCSKICVPGIYNIYYIYIFADHSQSESVLAYIVINQYFAILQTPISHYCNTLQSLILQIAIYLYCKVRPYKGPQGPTSRCNLLAWIASNRPEINANQRKTRKTASIGICMHP